MRIEYETELYHHGIKGMKWFHRIFQNEDGSYTALGKLRYGIGQKARERANTMSEWSRQHTSKAAANASKMHVTPTGQKRFDNPHMFAPTNETKAARSLIEEYTQAARANDQHMARMSEKPTQYAKDRLRAIATTFDGNRAVHDIAARSEYPGAKMRDRNDSVSQYMWQYVEKSADRGAKAREKAHTPVMSRADNANLYIQGAKNLAGNYARIAKDSLGAAGSAAKNGLQARAQDMAGKAGNAARSTSTELREILKAYGKDISGNASRLAQVGAREAGNIGERAKAGALAGATNAVLAGRRAASLARGAQRMYNTSDLALQVRGAKNLAGNYARIAKDSVGAAGRSARNALAGISGEDVLRGAQGAFGRTALGVYNGANRAGREAKTTAGALRNLAGVYGNDAMNRARSAKDNAVQRYMQYAYQKSADDPYKYKREVSPVDARRNEIANRMLNKGPQTSMTGRTVNDYRREMIERAQRSAKTANYQSEMISRAQNLAREANERAAAQRAAEPRREQSGYMDRIQALQNANRYRADIAAAGGTRQYTNPALALGQAARTATGIANSRAGNLSTGASAAARRGFNGYKNEHPNSEMSFDEYKRKYGWMYGGV